VLRVGLCYLLSALRSQRRSFGLLLLAAAADDDDDDNNNDDD